MFKILLIAVFCLQIQAEIIYDVIFKLVNPSTTTQSEDKLINSCTVKRCKARIDEKTQSVNIIIEKIPEHDEIFVLQNWVIVPKEIADIIKKQIEYLMLKQKQTAESNDIERCNKITNEIRILIQRKKRQAEERREKEENARHLMQLNQEFDSIFHRMKAEEEAIKKEEEAEEEAKRKKAEEEKQRQAEEARKEFLIKKIEESKKREIAEAEAIAQTEPNPNILNVRIIFQKLNIYDKLEKFVLCTKINKITDTFEEKSKDKQITYKDIPEYDFFEVYSGNNLQDNETHTIVTNTILKLKNAEEAIAQTEKNQNILNVKIIFKTLNGQTLLLRKIDMIAHTFEEKTTSQDIPQHVDFEVYLEDELQDNEIKTMVSNAIQKITPIKKN